MRVTEAPKRDQAPRRLFGARNGQLTREINRQRACFGGRHRLRSLAAGAFDE